MSEIRYASKDRATQEIANVVNTATPLNSGSGNVANASGVATLTPSATTTAYLTGFDIDGSGATAGAAVSVTVAGLLGGTRTFTYVFNTGVAVANASFSKRFSPALQASAVNTPIVVTCPASGAGGTNLTVNAYGFQL